MLAGRPGRGIISLIQLLLAGTCHVARIIAMPIAGTTIMKEKNGSRSPDDPELWIFLVTAVLLVLIGGAFAGLTIAYVYEISCWML